MTKNQSAYDALRHSLDTKMLRASSLVTGQPQREFVTETFVGIHNEYAEKRINHTEYVRLINRLAAYQQGAYNDYIDTLAGSAAMGMLDIAVQESKTQDIAAQSRKRSKMVTDITGVQPIQPEE